MSESAWDNFDTFINQLQPKKKTLSRHTGHSRRIKDELSSDILLWTPTHGPTSVGRLTRYTGHNWRIKDELSCNVLLRISTHGHANVSRLTGYMGHCRRIKDERSSDVLLWTSIVVNHKDNQLFLADFSNRSIVELKELGEFVFELILKDEKGNKFFPHEMTFFLQKF